MRPMILPRLRRLRSGVLALVRLRRQRYVRRDRDGFLRALVATAPPVEDAPPDEAPPAGEPPEVAPPAQRTPADQQFPPPEGGVPFRIPVVMLEGWETSDGRFWESGGVGRRDLPQTLMGMIRNPDGGVGHDAAFVFGRIDELNRYDASQVLNRETGEPYGEGVFAWEARGYIVPDTDDAAALLRAVRDRRVRGVSVDLAEMVGDMVVLEEDEDGFPTRVRWVFSQSSIGQATVTPFGAFPGAYIELDEDDAPLADDQLPQVASAALTTEGRDCVACEGALLGGGNLAVVASAGIAPEAPPASWFERVQIDNPQRHSYVERLADGTPTGRVYGYIAEWEVCHTGVRDACQLAPRLGENGYRTFMNGATLTAEGVEVMTGKLTLGGGHASLSLGVMPALAHYDNAGTAVADVVVGEDDFGIWYAGAFRPDVTREEVETFARHPLSGDWRGDPRDRQVRLVAALCVNTPGYPIGTRAHVASGGQRALVAAGARPLEVKRERAEAGGTDARLVQAAIDRALRPVLASAARARLRDLTRTPAGTRRT